MFRYVLLAIAFLVLVSVALLLALLALMVVAMACIVGIPLWYFGRNRLRNHGLFGASMNPMERLKNLYIEGKIDLFDFERRVARLIAVEH